MQLLEGQTLRDRLAASAGPLPLHELLDIGIQVSHGLHAAHERGILHRDIKPANIFLTGKGVCKILDFGLAKLLEADEEAVAVAGASSDRPFPRPSGLTVSRTGSTMGTAGYMSPEQVRGEKLDARSDLFSFGLVLYEMATGRRAFGGETAAVVQAAILQTSAVPVQALNPTLPAKLAATINKTFQKDREARYQTAAELMADLESRELGAQAPRSSRFWPRHRASLAASSLVVLGILGVLLYLRSHKPVPTFGERGTMVIADFVNTTGDLLFDGSLRQALALQMGQSPYFNVLPDGKIRTVLQQMKKSPGERLTPEVASEICVRAHSNAVLLGSIAPADNGYKLVLKAQSCQAGEPFEVVEAEARSQKQVLPALANAGNEMRRRLGESLASVQKFEQPLLEATTTSLAALQELSKTRTYGTPTENIPYVKRALELDPNFAWANEQLGAAYWNVGEGSLGAQYITKAFELRDRVSPRERFQIETAYHALVTRDLEKGEQTAKEWTQNYSSDWSPHNNLSIIYAQLGRPEDAVREIQEVIRLVPENPGAYANLVGMASAANKLGLAHSSYNEARDRDLDSPYLRESRFMLAFLQRDQAAMQEQVQWAAGKPRTEDVMLQHQADTESYYGQIQQARDTSNMAVQSAKGADAIEAAVQWELRQALAEVELGNLSVARRLTDEGLRLNKGRDNRIVAALIYARAGDSAKAENLSDELNKEFPLDTVLQNVALPSVRAAVALQKRKPFQAIEVLGVSEPYELGQATTSYIYTAYLRGEAYLQTSQPARAAIEFRKLINNPGIVGNFVSGALVHLQLGRAQEMMGDKYSATESYQEFLTLWKNADPNIPIYQQARAEYAKLSKPPVTGRQLPAKNSQISRMSHQ